MNLTRVYLLLWCAAVAILAFVMLDYYSSRNAPVFKRFERQWKEDVSALESSPKLPKPWFDVAEVEVIGGNPDAKIWLRQIEVPLKPKKKDGGHKLEILVVPWQEDGKTGVMLQYNLVNLKTKNMIYELGRTLILSQPREKDFFKSLAQEMRL